MLIKLVENDNGSVTKNYNNRTELRTFLDKLEKEMNKK
jgi:hypothetical protein